MPKRIKIIPFLLLTAGVALLYVRPIALQEGQRAILPFSDTTSDFGKYPVFERQNQIFVILSETQGEIFNPYFLKTLRNVTNDIFFLPGVDRSRITSLISTSVTYRDAVEDGFDGGPVVPEDLPVPGPGYAEIKKDLLKSPYVGQLVSYDLKSALIAVPFFNIVDGRDLTVEIQRLLPKNDRIRFSVLGYTPFLVSFKKELGHSLLALLLSWLAACLIFFIVTRRFAFSLLLGPLLTVVLQIVFYHFLNPLLHPLALPVLLFTFVLAFADRAWDEWHANTTHNPGLAAAALLPGISFYLLQSPLGVQMACLSLAGSFALFVTHELYRWTRPAVMDEIPPPVPIDASPSSLRVRSLLLILLLLTGLTAASTLFVGNRGSGLVLLRPNAAYQKAQQFLTDHFAATADSILIPALSFGQGCADPATVSSLEEFQWYLSGFPGVRVVSGLPEVVKKLNMLFHENNFKWRSIPREQPTLILTTSQLDVKTGLLDEQGMILPLTVFLKNHDPEVVAKIYHGMQKFQPSPLLTLKIAGGAAALEAILNESLAASAKYILLAFLTALLFATRFFMPSRQSIALGFLFCVILSLTLGFMAVTEMGLNRDTMGGLVLGSCLSLYFLWLHSREPAHGKKIAGLLILCCLMVGGGLFSEVNFIFKAAAVAECLLVLTGLAGFNDLS